MDTEASKITAAQMIVKRGLAAIPEDWHGCDAVWPALEEIANAGSTVVVKIDGQRNQEDDNGRYTIVISGGPLGEEFFRLDSRALEEGLAKAIVYFGQKCWT